MTIKTIHGNRGIDELNAEELREELKDIIKQVSKEFPDSAGHMRRFDMGISLIIEDVIKSAASSGTKGKSKDELTKEERKAAMRKQEMSKRQSSPLDRFSSDD